MLPTIPESSLATSLDNFSDLLVTFGNSNKNEDTTERSIKNLLCGVRSLEVGVFQVSVSFSILNVLSNQMGVWEWLNGSPSSPQMFHVSAFHIEPRTHPTSRTGNRMDLITLPHATLSFQDAYKYRNQCISLSLAAELTGCSYHSLYAYATRHRLARTVDKRTTLHIRFGDLLVYLVKREEREQAGLNDIYRRNSFAGARKRKMKESEQSDDQIILCRGT